MMAGNNIFSEDIEVPEIVQKKAGDAFFTIRKERNRMMENMAEKEQNGRNSGIRSIASGKKAVKAFAATAACAAVVVVAAGSLTGSFRGITERFNVEDVNTAEKGTGNAFFTAMEEADSMFTLKVKAAETEGGQPVPLSEGQPVPVTAGSGQADSWVFGADDIEEGVVDYCINIPQLTCEGENIQSVTYSINNGAFQIVQPENGESIVIDGQPYDGALNTGSIGGDYSEERDGQPSRPFETVLYKSFTLDYDRQSDEYTWINICNERNNSEESIPLIWKNKTTAEEYNSAIVMMLDSTVITCTVHYKDNTSQSADIKVDSMVMTRREAGEQLDPGMDPKELEEKTPVITFELQQ